MPYKQITNPHKLTREDRSKAGKASGVTKRKNKFFRELINDAFSKVGDDGSNRTLKEISADKLIEMASNGDLKSLELALRLNGELTNKLDINTPKSIKFDISDLLSDSFKSSVQNENNNE